MWQTGFGNLEHCIDTKVEICSGDANLSRALASAGYKVKCFDVPWRVGSVFVFVCVSLAKGVVQPEPRPVPHRRIHHDALRGSALSKFTLLGPCPR